MITDIALFLFALALVANVVALVRHWQMLRIMHIVLNNLIISQAQFNELMSNEQTQPPPRPEPSAPFNKA